MSESSAEQFNAQQGGQKACVTCGTFCDESEMYYADTGGLQCTTCYHDADADKVWDKGITAQAMAPVGLALLSFCFNPWLITSIITGFALFNTVRLVFSKTGSNEGLGVTSRQRTILIIGSVTSGVLFLGRLGLVLLEVIVNVAGQ